MYLGHQDLHPKAWCSPLMVLLPFSLERRTPQLPAVWDCEASWGSVRIPWVLMGAGLGKSCVGSQELLLVNNFPSTNTLLYASISCGIRARFLPAISSVKCRERKSRAFPLKSYRIKTWHIGKLLFFPSALWDSFSKLLSCICKLFSH